MKKNSVVIGAGLAGCEAAWQLSKRGLPVTLIEQKPGKMSPAHRAAGFAELVCSNSLRAEGTHNAVGLLKQEMRELGSLIMEAADATRVPAGGALAVDRHAFSQYITDKITQNSQIEICCEEAFSLPEEGVVIAAPGPLVEGKLLRSIEDAVSGGLLSFFDAAAPIITGESIDFSKAFFASRYGKGEGDGYVNCTMDTTQYHAFREALIMAETAHVHGFEDGRVFEGCMPVETMAKRGIDTLRFGPLKPVGITAPDGSKPYAVVQLRREDKQGRLFNLVGFQTHLKFPEQRRVFRMIPGLQDAEIVRYGVMHKNVFLKSPLLLNRYYEMKTRPGLFFAGQITGVEGYVESASSGLLAGLFAACDVLGKPRPVFSAETACGALAAYISGYEGNDFQPMNINYGIIGEIQTKTRGRDKKMQTSERALAEIQRVASEL
jgi:methylenetetrahydrofolate--tRNA-(uracil-5-)-methyltransferase